ncbi:phage portal protein, HK97 family [Actinomyces bovis]|uniref:Phage portal protein, HK97 family n=1 Tax=Actinomyces bovis TaxID=1658 RepID=A0ABY1VQ40_9ACTO|nr:phage portal protein [Actinomyces bovis]SPT53792.1 phage portal protein, HK97 family [Actinomyces bovis]VEG53145.1 phage portal protein, HK97 family [Actinomyces israelii]
MTFVVSTGSVQSLARPRSVPSLSLRVTDGWNVDYEEIWRTQGSVRTVVDFLARNIASLSPKVFERVSDTNRRRVTDHPLSELLARPNPRTTRYRLLNDLVHDMCIYDTAYWLKVKGKGTGGFGLVRLPPRMVTPKGDSWFAPDCFEVRGDKGRQAFTPDQIVHFRGYSPSGDLVGTPPMEALRQALAEGFEAGRMRSQILKNGARASGYLQRPADAPRWSEETREKFRRSWHNQYVGANSSEAGGTPILEDGMTFVKVAQTADELQYVEVRKLTREEVAAAFHVPAPMVGILDHATFSNIKEQHKQLYQDTLGPWLDQIEQELALQLIPDLVNDGRRLYVEFDIAAKMRGDLSEEATSLYQSVGGPFMTANEARARRNLPALPGGDDLIRPLSVTTAGGDAAPTDVEGEPKSLELLTKSDPKRFAPSPAQLESAKQQAAKTLSKFFKRQRAAVLSVIGAKSDRDWWDCQRWDTELADDLESVALSVTSEIGPAAAAALGFPATIYDVDRTRKFLRAVCESRAGAINSTTRHALSRALASNDESEEDQALPSPAAVFEEAVGSRGAAAAVTLATTFASFAVTESARQVAPAKAMKVWTVTSGNPRASHAQLDGETVPVDGVFSNGMAWPGDPVGGADEVAECRCTITTIIP